MDRSLKFFLLGFVVGNIIVFTPNPDEVDVIQHPEKWLKQMFAGGIAVWKGIYFSAVMIMLPFLALEPLKKRFPSSRPLFPLAFILGNSFALGIDVMIGLVSMLFE